MFRCRLYSSYSEYVLMSVVYKMAYFHRKRKFVFQTNLSNCQSLKRKCTTQLGRSTASCLLERISPLIRSQRPMIWRHFLLESRWQHKNNYVLLTVLLCSGHMTNTCFFFGGGGLIAFICTLLHSCYILFFTELLLTSSQGWHAYLMID